MTSVGGKGRGWTWKCQNGNVVVPTYLGSPTWLKTREGRGWVNIQGKTVEAKGTGWAGPKAQEILGSWSSMSKAWVEEQDLTGDQREEVSPALSTAHTSSACGC